MARVIRSYKLPRKLDSQLTDLARLQGRTRTAVVLDALRHYFDDETLRVPAPLRSLEELLAEELAELPTTPPRNGR